MKVVISYHLVPFFNQSKRPTISRLLSCFSTQRKYTNPPSSSLSPHTLTSSRGGVLCVAMDVGGEVCFSGSADSNIRVWRVPSTDNDPYNNYGM